MDLSGLENGMPLMHPDRDGIKVLVNSPISHDQNQAWTILRAWCANVGHSNLFEVLMNPD
jgi:hypothetical protein